MRNRTISRCFEPIDDFLEGQNLSRKQIPRDASSLFRAVAEKKFLTQRFHVEVRQMCLDYMASHKEDFQNLIPESETIENHISKMRSPLEWPHDAEIHALSLLFHVDLIFYYENFSQSEQFTESEAKHAIILYRDNCNHFDLVIPRNTTSIAGFCQALVYQMLYTNVFKVENVMSIVDKMLHDTSSAFRKDSTNSNDAQDIIRIVEHVTDPNKTADSLLNISMEYTSSPVQDITPPFPYRVAKALDPDLYRNSDFDIYTAKRKEIRYGPYDSKGLQIGVKVVIKASFLSKEDKDKYYDEKEKKFLEEGNSKESVLHGHIQLMSDNHGLVLVYVEEFAKKISVPYESLEKYNLTQSRPANELVHWYGSPYRTSVRRPVLPITDICNSPTYAKKKKKFAFPTPLHVQPKNDGEAQQKITEVNHDLQQQTASPQEIDEGADSCLTPPNYLGNSFNSSYDYPGYYMMNNLPMPSPGTHHMQDCSKQFECSMQIDSSGMAMNLNGQYYPGFACFPMAAEAYNPPLYGFNYNYPVPFMYGTPPGAHHVQDLNKQFESSMQIDSRGMAVNLNGQCYHGYTTYFPIAPEIAAAPPVDESFGTPQEFSSTITYPGYESPGKLQPSNDKRISQFEGQPLIKAFNGES